MKKVCCKYRRPAGAPRVGEAAWPAYLRRLVLGAFRRFENEELKNEEIRIKNCGL